MLRLNPPFLLLDSAPELFRFLGGALLVSMALVLWWGILRQLR